MRKDVITRLVAAFTVLVAMPYLTSHLPGGTARAEDCSPLPQTGHSVCGRFLQYWTNNGGLEQYGYPISDLLQEPSETNGTTYQVQYFERARFEQHPENQPPDDVLLSLLGVLTYRDKYGPVAAPAQQPSVDNPKLFPETGKVLGGTFRTYWETHGGLARFGYPISDEFSEASSLNGQPYTVQYFERAEFEHHPENAGTPYEVLLTQLGRQRYQANYASLTIPAPSSNDLLQLYPQGSGSYLAWAEVKESLSLPPNPRRIRKTVGIYALNLASGRAQAVTVAPDIGADFTLSGSNIYWSERDVSCTADPNNCTTTFKGKDLNTGDLLFALPLPAKYYVQSFAGFEHKIVWLRYASGGEEIVLEEPDKNKQTILDTIPSGSPTTIVRSFQPPEISGRFIVWSDRTWVRNVSGDSYNIKVYDIEKREMRYVESGILTRSHRVITSLSNSLLIWADPAIHYLNLETGSQGFVTDHDPNRLIQRGDSIVWNRASSDGWSIWGAKFSAPDALNLIASAGSDGDPTLAGDFLVWSQSHRLLALRLSQAFSLGRPQPTPIPGSTGNNVRFVAHNVEESPVSAGNKLFWTSRGTNTRIYMYDLTEKRQRILYESPGYKAGLTTDGKSLVWVEMDLGERYRIRRYDLETKRVDMLVQPWHDGETFGIYENSANYGFQIVVAIDGTKLYYQRSAPSDVGLWQMDLNTGTEQSITPNGRHPVAADGNLIWSEGQAIMLKRGSNPALNEQVGSLRVGNEWYSMSGDNIVWSDGSSINRYYILGHSLAGPPEDPETGSHYVTYPLVSGNLVVWTDELVDRDRAEWSIKSFEFNTQERATIVANYSIPSQQTQPLQAWAIVDGRTVAYTPGYGYANATYDLYLADLAATASP